MVERFIAVSCCRSARFSEINSRWPRSANTSARPITMTKCIRRSWLASALKSTRTSCGEDQGVEVEVIDLCSLLTNNKAALFASVEKTSRALIVHEDVKALAIGAEISAVIVEERFDSLDGPVFH